MTVFDSSIVAGIGSGNTGDRVAFDADWLTTAHAGNQVVLRIRDADAGVYRTAVIQDVINARLCSVNWATAAPRVGVSTVLWEESAMSAARGYARSVAIYQQRLCFGGLRDAGSVLLMSKPGQFRNFDLGEAKDADGIAVQALGGVHNIRHLVARPHLTMLSDNGASYIIEDATKPLTPSTIRAQAVAGFGIGNARPGYFDGGLLCVADTGNAVRDLTYAADGTAIQAEPVSLAATGFLNVVVDAAYLSGSTDRPEELAFFVNRAGRIAVFHSVRSQKTGAWLEWSTAGAWTAVAVAGKRLFAVVVREAGTYLLEQFDWTTPLDSSVTVPAGDPAVPLALAHVPDGLNAHGLDAAGDYLGSGVLAGGLALLTRQQGDLASRGTGDTTLGISFPWFIDPLPPAVDLADGTLLRRTQRLVRTHLKLLATQTCRNGGEVLEVRGTADAVEAVALAVTRWWMTSHLGWSRPAENGDAVVPRITRTLPLPATVLALKREVKA